MKMPEEWKRKADTRNCFTTAGGSGFLV